MWPDIEDYKMEWNTKYLTSQLFFYFIVPNYQKYGSREGKKKSVSGGDTAEWSCISTGKGDCAPIVQKAGRFFIHDLWAGMSVKSKWTTEQIGILVQYLHSIVKDEIVGLIQVHAVGK